MTNALSVRALTKKFGDKTAVDALDLDIRAGEIYALLGPNGAGKTTTLRMVTGLLKPDSGSIQDFGADAIADLALENFVEMRDKVADPRFLLSKAVGLALEQRFPERFVPKYSMVSFHRIPYAVALRRGRVQDDILERLCEGIARVEDVDWNLAERLLVDRLLPFHQDIAIN